MNTLLFVDDEKNILSGLRRLLSSKRKEWNMMFALSGEEALELLENNVVDIIISDMKMPHMNGAELLIKVRKKYPAVTRISLSGYSEPKLILESIKATHLYLSKPTDFATLTSALERCLSIRSTIQDKNLHKFMSGISCLSCMPPLYSRLLHELSLDEASTESVGIIISDDVAMTSKLLHIVNTPYFNPGREILSPIEATVHLGIDIIKSIVLTVNIFEVSQKQLDWKSLDPIMQRSIRIGALAKKIALSEGFSQIDADRLLISGMLQNIGLLVVVQYFTEDISSRLLQSFLSNSDNFRDEELHLIGTSHGEISAYLLNLWGYPIPIVECVANHHSPDVDKEGSLTMQHILFCANTLIDGDCDVNENLVEKGLITTTQKLAWLKHMEPLVSG